MSFAIVIIFTIAQVWRSEYSSYILTALIAFSIIVGLLTYFWFSKKPFAEIAGDKLTIRSVSIKKDDVNSMSYIVINKNEHELHIDVEGYSNWVLRLTTEDVDIENMAVFRFLKDNFYPLVLVRK